MKSSAAVNFVCIFVILIFLTLCEILHLIPWPSMSLLFLNRGATWLVPQLYFIQLKAVYLMLKRDFLLPLPRKRPTFWGQTGGLPNRCLVPGRGRQCGRELQGSKHEHLGEGCLAGRAACAGAALPTAPFHAPPPQWSPGRLPTRWGAWNEALASFMGKGKPETEAMMRVLPSSLGRREGGGGKHRVGRGLRGHLVQLLPYILISEHVPTFIFGAFLFNELLLICCLTNQPICLTN